MPQRDQKLRISLTVLQIDLLERLAEQQMRSVGDQAAYIVATVVEDAHRNGQLQCYVLDCQVCHPEPQEPAVSVPEHAAVVFKEADEPTARHGHTSRANSYGYGVPSTEVGLT